MRLWQEITSEDNSVLPVLKSWKQRTIQSDEAGDVPISNISPFRMVLHKTRRMKMFNGAMKGASKCNYFALMWIPSNIEDGMNEDEFNALIEGLREDGYFVNKLNKEAVYISGPSYGNSEDIAGGGESDEKFDLIPLSTMCQSFLDLEDQSSVTIEISVHELAREV